jgi:hypothetical protein
MPDARDRTTIGNQTRISRSRWLALTALRSSGLRMMTTSLRNRAHDLDASPPLGGQLPSRTNDQWRNASERRY